MTTITMYECDTLGYCPYELDGALSCRTHCGLGAEPEETTDLFDSLDELFDVPNSYEDDHDEQTIEYHRRQLQIEYEDEY